MLKDKVAVVTGAGGGIGRECAITLAKQHARILVLGRHQENIEQTSDIIRTAGGDCTYLKCDIAVKEDVELLAEYIENKLGKIDILVNNAALFLPTDIMKDKLEPAWDDMISVNIKGMIEMIHTCLPYMSNQENASIINLASIDAFAGCLNYAGYSMTKGAVISLTRGLALDLGTKNVRVNVVAPGITDTPMTHERIATNLEAYIKRIPLKKIGKAQDIANAVLFLASDMSSYITGETINVNGGMQFI